MMQRAHSRLRNAPVGRKGKGTVDRIIDAAADLLDSRGYEALTTNHIAEAAGANTFVKAGLPFTFSHDAPVTPSPSILELVDAGVNRTTASGRVIGPDERVSPYNALR
ncbi:MAG: TetR family transcriptional regulator, partial [Erythrobacteraceae bacterium]